MTLHLERQLLRREKNGNLRHLQTPQQLVDFSSNDYLGLARSASLAAAARREWEGCAEPLHGLGSTGSRLLSGNTAYAQALEDSIANFHGYAAGVIFNCGYMANVGLLSIIGGGEGDVVFFDSAVHASMRDGMRLSRASTFAFRHNDVAHLETRLKNCSAAGERCICIESIYSTDGSRAPLMQISLLARKYEAFLIVDEAHAVGVYGPSGRGLVAEENLSSHVFAQVTTFGKALGTHGAIVMGNTILKRALINFATPYIYTTALPLHALAAIKCSYGLLPSLERERKHLRKLVQIFADLHPQNSSTHIQQVRIAGNESVRQLSSKLASRGYDVRALTSPTVRRGHEVLRICLHAFNTEKEVLGLLEQIEFHRGVSRG